MENSTLTTLTQIYNTLSIIDTHGDGTMKMALCLDALSHIIQDLSDVEKTPTTCDCAED